MSKGTFKTLCNINTALGGSNEGCVGNKDVLDRIAVALGASSSAKTKYSAEAMEAIAENIDDESPVEVAKLRNSVTMYRDLAAGASTASVFSDPELSALRQNAFQSCTFLREVDLPAVTSIDSYAFGYCSNLRRVAFENAISVNVAAFAFCSNLSEVSFPNLKSIESVTGYQNGAFQSCSSLTQIDLPEVTDIGASAFMNCTSLNSVSIPKVQTVGSAAFSSCAALTEISLPAVTEIGYGAFYKCTMLESVFLDVAAVPTLDATAAFASTSSNLTFYVRASMISAFQSASNWSAYASQFSAIPVDE